MKNRDGHGDDEEKLAAPVRDYRTLLEMTRALVIVRSRASSAGLSIYGDQATSFEARKRDTGFVLNRGEIVDPDFPWQRTIDDEGPVTAVALSHTSSNLTIKIYVGMS